MDPELNERYLDRLYTRAVQEHVRRMYRRAEACVDASEQAAIRAEFESLSLAARTHKATFTPMSSDPDDY